MANGFIDVLGLFAATPYGVVAGDGDCADLFRSFEQAFGCDGADYAAFLNIRVFEQSGFEFLRLHVLAAAEHDYIFLPSRDKKIAVAVQLPESLRQP